MHEAVTDEMEQLTVRQVGTIGKRHWAKYCNDVMKERRCMHRAAKCYWFTQSSGFQRFPRTLIERLVSEDLRIMNINLNHICQPNITRFYLLFSFLKETQPKIVCSILISCVDLFGLSIVGLLVEKHFYCDSAL